MDPKGHECQRASLMDDGSLILRSGMTAQGYFTEKDKWVPSKDLIGLDLDGKPIQITPSTLGVATQMEEQVELESLMDLCVDSIYLLEPIDLAEKTESFLESGGVFRFSFNSTLLNTDSHTITSTTVPLGSTIGMRSYFSSINICFTSSIFIFPCAKQVYLR